MRLQPNFNKMGMQDRDGPQWEWHTAKITSDYSIHIHNQLGSWIYEIHSLSHRVGGKKFDTKALAYQAALKRLAVLLEAAMRELEGELE